MNKIDTSICLADPAVEPSDEQLNLIMHDVAKVTKGKAVRAKEEHLGRVSALAQKNRKK